MRRSRKQLLWLVLALPVLVVVFGVVYQWGMGTLEGEPRDLLESIEWASETFTTTGYGADSRWRHPAMAAFVMFVQLVGVFLVYLVIPIVLVPFLEERFEVRLPREVRGLKGHVVIYGYGPAVEPMIDQLARVGVETVVVESREAEARRLLDADRKVVYRRLHEGALNAAELGQAKALIVNAADEDNAAAILVARQQGFGGDVLALVEEPVHRRPMTLAGATAVYTPRHMLGAALAARASTRISPRISGLNQLSDALSVREIRLRPTSSLAGQTLAASGIGARTGAVVIGQWVAGRLVTRFEPSTVLEPNGILVVAGNDEALARLSEVAQGAHTYRQEGPFVVCGYGEVGQKVAQLLTDAGEAVRVLDRKPLPGVDLVGDVLDVSVLQRGEVGAAQAVIVAVDSDSATLFATVILKDLAPAVPVIARVNSDANIERTHGAGADFVLSLGQVAAQVLARKLLGEQAVSINPQLKLRKVGCGGMVGRTPAELVLRRETGCSVVAVERQGRVLANLGGEFRFESGDVVFLCGSSEDVDHFPDRGQG